MVCFRSHRWRRGVTSIVVGALAISVVCKCGWVDPDTPLANRRTQGFRDGFDYELVFSDEFNKEGRRFDDGHDPKWSAIHKNDYTNAALHFYSKEAVRTHKGKLVIKTTNDDITFSYHDDKAKTMKTLSKTYISGMLQSWNKFCFTGGIIEVSAALPGDADTGGLWPAIWLLGNLARATYTSSSDFIWPWSYNKCDRSTDEKTEWQYQQETSACDSSVHYGFHRNTGRGAPEIDILEAMAGKDPYDAHFVGKPYVSHSFQVSPGTAENRPAMGMWPDPGTWYEKGLEYGNETSPNLYFYGTHLLHKPTVTSYWADAISANHRLTESHFINQHIYRVEWQPGDEGFIRWYLDGAFVFGMTQETLEKNGAVIPFEPMYILFNTAVSTMWGFPAPCPEAKGCPCDCFDAREVKCGCALPGGMADQFPANFRIDFVRVYQNLNDTSHTLGCSTLNMPSEKWIKGHSERYKDPLDKHVLRPVRSGGGKCKTDSHCGTPLHPIPPPAEKVDDSEVGGVRRLTESTIDMDIGGSLAATKDEDEIIADEEEDEEEGLKLNHTKTTTTTPDTAAYAGVTSGLTTPMAEEGEAGQEVQMPSTYGRCVQERCVCAQGYTGPHCLSPEGYNDAQWLIPKGGIPHLREPEVPLTLAACAAMLIGGLVMTCMVRLSHLKSRRRFGRVDSSLLTVPPLPPSAVPPGYAAVSPRSRHA